jgi:Domain of unknown function (DUF5666)
MKTQSSSRCAMFVAKLRTALPAFFAVAALGLSVGCSGGSGSQPPTPTNTQVTVVQSASGNDQLNAFTMNMQSLTLTNQAGGTVTLLGAVEPLEFMHVNAGIEPLVTVTIPSGTYTAATATLGDSGFLCTTVDNTGTLFTSSFNDSPTPAADVTVTLPAPIVISGESMTLNLELLVESSGALSNCDGDAPGDLYSVTPTFSLAPASFSAQATNPGNGKVEGMTGQVASVDTANTSFVVDFPLLEAPRSVPVSSGMGTAYQGINSFAGLAVGSLVNMDGIVQSDGSLAATRIAVLDPNATAFAEGPVIQTSAAVPVLLVEGLQAQGALFNHASPIGLPFSLGNATFQISGQLSNVSGLPFTASFDAANVVPGQFISASTTATGLSPEPVYAAAQTVTLVPQLVDGTVSGTSTAGSFTVYSVSLAPYELFAALAVQPGQNSLLTNASQMQVYVDSSTQLLNSQPLAANGVFRFYGLVFNDHGTLRMDCARVNDGVAVQALPVRAPGAAP